jgi:bifunctional N-acetylglucosamine-1-phosphate-uridyltransferase/glucosamine-1-phosphate-acetyltransferase GlmU-like protein
MTDLSSVGVVVLAAGKGTRLNCVDIPKVMLEIGGKPIVSYTVETLRKVGFKKEQICLVVGFCKEKVMDYFKDTVSYAVQTDLRGTANAAFIGMQTLPKNITQVLVLGGDDSAFYRPDTIRDFINRHEQRQAKLSLLVATVEQPIGLGRIFRHENGEIEIIEKEYLTEEQKLIKEISTGTFIFDRKWFEEMYPTMPPMQKLNEYGLPTALAVARKMRATYQIVKLEHPDEWFGINTPEEYAEANKRKQITK